MGNSQSLGSGFEWQQAIGDLDVTPFKEASYAQLIKLFTDDLYAVHISAQQPSFQFHIVPRTHMHSHTQTHTACTTAWVENIHEYITVTLQYIDFYNLYSHFTLRFLLLFSQGQHDWLCPLSLSQENRLKISEHIQQQTDWEKWRNMWVTDVGFSKIYKIIEKSLRNYHVSKCMTLQSDQSCSNSLTLW